MAFDAHGAYMGSGNAPMQNFQMTPGNVAGGQKNYVFVDEHNRHKRLKVMRACEGCRRRKIKCDAATTNTWPCSACRRLKLHCQPPTISQDGAGGLSDSDADFQQGTIQGLDPSHMGMESQHYGTIPPSHFAAHNQQYAAPMPQYVPQYHDPQPDPQQQMYQQLQQPIQQPQPMTAYTQPQAQPAPQAPPSSYYSPPPRLRTGSSSSPLDPENSTAEELTGAMGDLQIGEDGIAPYLRKAQSSGKEVAGPVQDFDADVKLPPLSTGAGSQIRIPPALLPSEEDAASYFQVFFDDIHPYVPVINRAQFMRQWQTDRKSISPLLLEAIFACSGRLSDDPAQGAQWLALAARHEDYFLDHPRLSTLQALLLLLKAREAAPKRGYFYKSWMTVKTIVSMAKSLELHEHLEEHEINGACDSDPIECLTKTRVWQTLMLVEMMVGGPQGRHDFGVDPETVDLRPNPPNANMSTYEAGLSRQFAYFVRNAMNIRVYVSTYIKLKKQKDWFTNPKFTENNERFFRWPKELPVDLNIQLPPNGAAPAIPSHFLGNMHSHFQLGIIMLQRPQLLGTKSMVGVDDHWRMIFSNCYGAAKILCRLQEAILVKYGISGLLVMQRGINFTIYAVLTCTMLHLVAITSPYPEFNIDAREYFTRHMRILEQCTASWPMPDVQEQVDALRMAFSADINRPFELKQSFPYSSPSEGYQPSPPMDMHYPVQLPREHSFETQQPIQYQTITPPISAGPHDRKNDSPHMQQPMNMMSSSHPSAAMVQAWDPSRIINQWDSAFAIPPSAMAPPGPSNSPPMHMSMATSTSPMQQQQQQQAQYSSPYSQASTGMTPLATTHAMANQQQQQQQQYLQQQQQAGPVFVSPRDWQQSVASVYDPEGLKRRWDPR